MRAMRSAGESAILCPTRALLQTSSGRECFVECIWSVSLMNNVNVHPLTAVCVCGAISGSEERLLVSVCRDTDLLSQHG